MVDDEPVVVGCPGDGHVLQGVFFPFVGVLGSLSGSGEAIDDFCFHPFDGMAGSDSDFRFPDGVDSVAVDGMVQQ